MLRDIEKVRQAIISANIDLDQETLRHCTVQFSFMRQVAKISGETAEGCIAAAIFAGRLLADNVFLSSSVIDFMELDPELALAVFKILHDKTYQTEQGDEG